MLHHSGFNNSKYHKSENKYGSLSSHKRRATRRMNNPHKLELINKGLEKIYKLCDRCVDKYTPEQFIEPCTHKVKGQIKRYVTHPAKIKRILNA